MDRDAARLLDSLCSLERLAEEVCERDVDFVENDRVRSLGRNQLDPSKIAELKQELKAAAKAWFAQECARLRGELAELGVSDNA